MTSNDYKYSGYPSIDSYKDFVHVVWMDQRHYPITNRPEVYYRNSTDNGRTWNSEVRLTFSDSTKTYPRIAVNGNIIHVIWVDDRDGGWKVCYINSTDGGNTWSTVRMISSFASSDNPAIAVIGGNIHVVFISNFKLFYLNSTNNGITWSIPQQLTGSNRDSNHPAIAVSGNDIHILWMDHYDKNGQGTAGAIFYINSTDNGLTWSEDINLTPMNLDASYSDIGTNGNIIHVVFSEQVSGVWETHYRRSEDGGTSWSEDIQLTNWGRDHHGSSINIYDNNVRVIWWTSWLKEPDGNGEIYYINSTDNGYSWSESLRLTYASGPSGSADLSVNSRTIHVAWADKRSGEVEVFYKYYPFYPPPTNLTIDIQGIDLFLNWTPPHNSPSPVSHYNIYRSSKWDGFDFSVPWVNTSIDLDPIDGMLIPLRTTWNNTFAYSDDNNYFYIVRAMNNEGWNDTNTNIVGKYVISLEKGWNLISLPLTQKDTNISEVLKSIDGDFNIVQWYDAKDGIWHSSTGDLTEINRTMGFWIHMKNSAWLKIVGSVTDSTSIALYEGWNLVGYPSFKIRELNDAFNGINWKAVQCYDAIDSIDPWKHYNPDKPENINDLNEMQPGRGYWVYVTINDTWTRTRTDEDNKMVIWRVGDSEENVVRNQPFYGSTKESSIDMEEDDDYKLDNDNEEKAIAKDEENNLVPSLVPFIILIAIIFVEIKMFHKKKK